MSADSSAAAFDRLLSALVSARDYLLRAMTDAVYNDDPAGRDYLETRAGGMTFAIDALTAALPIHAAAHDASVAKVARVEALADEWSKGCGAFGIQLICADRLRGALKDEAGA